MAIRTYFELRQQTIVKLTVSSKRRIGYCIHIDSIYIKRFKTSTEYWLD